MSSKTLLREKFHGALVGAVIGDCLGAVFEFQTRFDGIKREDIIKKLKPAKKMYKKMFEYTDDTAMALSVCKSLLRCDKFDPVHMAKCFTNEYIASPNRGYGSAVVDIFEKWNTTDISTENVFDPSKEQFDGAGSYGNGAAMRVSPVALFAKDIDECIEIARESALLTHSHKHGINGAILQALAVFQILHSRQQLQPQVLLKHLKDQMKKIEGELIQKHTLKVDKEKESSEDLNCHEILYNHTRSSEYSFVNQLDVVENLLRESKASNCDDTHLVIKHLGCDVTAQQAVPTALYCFLKNIDKGFEETLYYSISVGGDTDTISTMSCAMAGAYYGLAGIPQEWINICESAHIMKMNAEEFFIKAS